MKVLKCVGSSLLKVLIMHFLHFCFDGHQISNFLSEDLFRLGDGTLDFDDLFVDQLVDLLHVVEHGVGFFVEAFEFGLVVSQFVALIQNKFSRGVPRQLLSLSFTRSIRCSIIYVNLTILFLLIEFLNRRIPLLATRFPHLFQIPGK